MITYVELKNFKSFKNTRFDFRKGKKSYKKFVAIYGENGSGKSNFVDSLSFLRLSLESFHMVDPEQLQQIQKTAPLPDKLVAALTKSDLLEGVVGEKLYYFTGKQSGVMFDLSIKDGQISTSFCGSFFNTREAERELKTLIDQYWGKHSLLSILHNERERKNTEYINKSYLPNVFEPINMILFLTAKHSMGSLKAQNANVNYKGVIDNPMEGLIASAHEQALDQTERILNGFFTQAYSDIKQVFYQKNPEGPNLHYRLFVQKMIGGQIRSINFLEESEGTKRILFMINDLLGACQGGTIALDEIDTGVHDLLLKTMLESIDDWIDGQLIITTHNTYLLETLRPQSIYVINVDYLGNKEVHCLDEYDIHGTNNVRSMYIKGLFGGVPVVDEIEYGEIVEELRESGVPQEETE